MNIKNWLKKRKAERSGKLIRHGSYSIGYTVLVLLVLLVINLIISELPSGYTKKDLSTSGLYSISDQTREVLDELTEEVTLYLVCQDGNEDSTITNLLEQYEEYSDHIDVIYKDPVKSPAFTSSYTTEQLYDNSIIAECGQQSRVISYDAIYSSEYDYYSGTYSTTEFDGEGQITSAIAYVTSEDLPVMYVVNGHREAEISSSVKNAVEKENVRLEELNLITADAVPEDASCLFLYAPLEDYTEDEAQKVISYLENGGNALIISSYTETDMPNFRSILSAYGLKTGDGLILEGDSGYTLAQNPLYLVPDYELHSITEDLKNNNRYVAVPVAQSVETLDVYRDSLTIEPLLVTSASAYEKADPETMTNYSKEADDREGPFTLAAAVTEPLDDERETKLVYYTTEGILEDSMNQAAAGGNMELFTSSLSYLVDHELSVSIPAKSLDITNLSITSKGVNMWSILVTVLLPLTILITGAVVCFRRRKR
ncbi:MAG: Gldg family protein [Lachnospiraceae bacterium]|nr:Gldg family protein [Lachnospiraceae bacterium]